MQLQIPDFNFLRFFLGSLISQSNLITPLSTPKSSVLEEPPKPLLTRTETTTVRILLASKHGWLIYRVSLPLRNRLDADIARDSSVIWQYDVVAIGDEQLWSLCPLSALVVGPTPQRLSNRDALY